MSLRMNATLYSDTVRIERGDYLLFQCEMISQIAKDRDRIFCGCYYPRWHGFYLEEVRDIIGHQGYSVKKHFPAYTFDVYLKENGDPYLTEDFQVDNILILGGPQNQRDEDVKRYRIVSVDDTRLKTRTGGLSPIQNSSVANPGTVMTTTGTRVPLMLSDEVLDILNELRNAYVHHVGGGIPEIGIKAMGRPFRVAAPDGRRWMTLEGITTLVQDSRALWTTLSPGDTQRTKDSIAHIARCIWDAFPSEPQGIDYDVFMDYIRGPMSSKRKAAVLEIFNLLDYDKDGKITIIDLTACFNAQAHPVVVADEIFSADRLLKGFLTWWDYNHHNYGLIPFTEFIDYYNGLSAVIKDDEVFLSIVATTWKQPRWHGSLIRSVRGPERGAEVTGA